MVQAKSNSATRQLHAARIVRPSTRCVFDCRALLLANKAIASPSGNNAQTASATMHEEIMHNGTERTREDAAGSSITDKTSPVFIRLSRGTSYQLQTPFHPSPPQPSSVGGVLLDLRCSNCRKFEPRDGDRVNLITSESRGTVCRPGTTSPDVSVYRSLIYLSFRGRVCRTTVKSTAIESER